MKYSWLIKQLNKNKFITPEENEIIIYGLNNFIFFMVNFIISVCISLVLHSSHILMLTFACFFPLRRQIGTYHCNHPLACVFLSQLFLLVPQIIFQKFTINKLVLHSFICIIIMLATIFYSQRISKHILIYVFFYTIILLLACIFKISMVVGVVLYCFTILFVTSIKKRKKI